MTNKVSRLSKQIMKTKFLMVKSCSNSHNQKHFGRILGKKSTLNDHIRYKNSALNRLTNA